MPRLLAEEEIKKKIENLKDWKFDNNFLTKELEFKDFKSVIKFVNKVAKVAEEFQHHPDIYIRYNKVKLMLQTHSENGVTSWDIQLARLIEKLLKSENKK